MSAKIIAVLAGALFMLPAHTEAGKDNKAVLLILDPGHGGKDRGGYSGRGFKWSNGWAAEDLYTYDIALRVKRLADARGWKIFFTIIDPDSPGIGESDDMAMRPNASLYDLPGKRIKVFAGEEGLRKRIKAAESIRARHPQARPIFISIHFDDAGPLFSGAEVFTAPGLARHPLVKTLVEKFRAYDLGPKFGFYPRRGVNDKNDLRVLKEGNIVPRVLLELGNFNNERDREMFLSGAGREKYARIIVEAIEGFLKAENE